MKHFLSIILLMSSFQLYNLESAFFKHTLPLVSALAQHQRKITVLSGRHRLLTKEDCVPIVVTDCDGTVAGDTYPAAPTLALQKVFNDHGITLSFAQIEEAMGMDKKEHIKHIVTSLPEIEHFFGIKDENSQEAVVEELFEDYKAIQPDFIRKHSQLVPGALKAFEKIRSMGVPYIGATTGYPRLCAQVFEETVNQQGLFFDKLLSSEDVGGHGRPTSKDALGGYQMMQKHMENAGVNDPCLVLKCGDTQKDIWEAKALDQIYCKAAWALGFVRTGLYKSLDYKEACQKIGVTFGSPHSDHTFSFIEDKIAPNKFEATTFGAPTIKSLPFFVQVVTDLNYLNISVNERQLIYTMLSDRDYQESVKQKVQSY